MLEKILQEIEQYEESYEGPGTLTLCPGWVKEIIRNNIQENDGWIPVEDGMPEEKYQKNKVWITIETEKGNRVSVKGYEYCGEFYFSNGNKIKKYKVIAWKPYTYPKPYRKDGE